MGVTADPRDPRLTRGVDEQPREQAEVYLVLSVAERLRAGLVRPLREAYRHDECGQITTMAYPIAETYARDPSFYWATYCAVCRKHRPLAEFHWLDGEVMGS